MTTFKFSLADYAPFAAAKERHDKIKAAVDAAEKVPLEELTREADQLKKASDNLAIEALLDESLKKQAEAAANKTRKALSELTDEKARRENLNAALEKARDEMESHREAAEMLVYEKAKIIHQKLVKNSFAAVRVYAAAHDEEVALNRALYVATAKQARSDIFPALLPGELYMGREDDWSSPISACLRRARNAGYEV